MRRRYRKARRGRGVDRAARRRAADRRNRLPARRVLHRDRVPAVHLHADRRADRARHLSRRASAPRASFRPMRRRNRAAESAAGAGMTGADELRALTSVRGIAAWMVVLYHIRLSIAGLPAGVGARLRQGVSGGRFLLPAVGVRDLAELGRRGCATTAGARCRRSCRSGSRGSGRCTCSCSAARSRWRSRSPRPGGTTRSNIPFARTAAPRPAAAELGLHRPAGLERPGLVDQLRTGRLSAFPLLVRAVDWRALPSWLVASAAVAIPRHARRRDGGRADARARYRALRLGPLPGRIRRRQRGLRAVAALARRAVCPGVGCLRRQRRPRSARGRRAYRKRWPCRSRFARTVARSGADLGTARPIRSTGHRSIISARSATRPISSHFMLFVVFKLAFVDDAHAVPPVLIALYLAMVLGCSVALYHLVERPAQRVGERHPFCHAGTRAN